MPDLLDDRLFGPMGAEDAEWDRVASGTTFGFHGLHLTTEAVAAFGELLLRHGSWRGRQLVASEWVEAATTSHVDTLQTGDGWRTADWLQGYGYHFWMSRHGYRADGVMGQYCLVVPEHEFVVVMTAAATDMRMSLDLVWECLLPGLDATGRTEDDRVLAERMGRLTLSRETGDSSPERSATAVIDATTGVSALPHGTSVVIDAVGGGWRVRLGTGEAVIDVVVGDGTWRERAPLGRPVVASGAWQGGVFVADLARSGDHCNGVSVDLCRGAPAEDLAGAAVHLGGDVVELVAADLVEVGALREVLA